MLSYPVSAASWHLENEDYGYKVLDKSCFLNKGTAIPIKLRQFFIEGVMQRGEKRNLLLTYKGKKYKAHIKMLTDEALLNPRTHLLWEPDFMELLAVTYPAYYKIMKSKERHERKPSDVILGITRVNGFTEYAVSFKGNRDSGDIIPISPEIPGT